MKNIWTNLVSAAQQRKLKLYLSFKLTKHWKKLFFIQKLFIKNAVWINLAEQRLVSLTCSGVAVMGLGISGACVAGGTGEAGLGVVGSGEVGARYLTMAGSTSGVPYDKNKYINK